MGEGGRKERVCDPVSARLPSQTPPRAPHAAATGAGGPKKVSRARHADATLAHSSPPLFASQIRIDERLQVVRLRPRHDRDALPLFVQVERGHRPHAQLFAEVLVGRVALELDGDLKMKDGVGGRGQRLPDQKERPL